MKFQLIDISYHIDYGNPVINLWGRQENGEVAHIEVVGFQPYFYIVPTDEIRLLAELDNREIQWETVERYLPLYYQKNKTKCIKVLVDLPGNIPKLREELSQYGNIYEADILFRNKFLSDVDLHGCDNLECSNRTVHYTEISKAEAKIIPKVMAYDIEVLPPEIGVPNPKNDQIIIISLVCNDGYKKLLVAKDGTDTTEREFLGSELAVLKRFIQLVKKVDPDIIIDYNGDHFDIPYIIQRLQTYNLIANIGRDNREWQQRSFGGNVETLITGRVHMDVMKIIQKNFQLANYSLAITAKEIIGKEKLDVPASKMREIWNNNDINEFLEYAEVDAKLTLDLLIETKLLDKYIAIAKISGALLHNVINGGQTQLIEPLLLKEFYKENRLFPNRPTEAEMEERKKYGKYEGAFVGDPVLGLHKNIAVVDAQSLYPTSMISHNVCVTSLSEEGTIIAPNGAKYISRDIYVGIIPRVLDKLFQKRLDAKAKMKITNDKAELDYLDSIQYAIKIYLNSMYGLTGFVGSRFYIKDIAASITSIGRDAVLLAMNIIKNDGYEVFGGDTDSVFIGMPTWRSEKDIAIELEPTLKKINDSLIDPMKFLFEHFFKSGIFFAKKRYILLDNDDKYKIRGIELRRRDWAPITVKTMQRVFDLILKEDDLNGALQYAQNAISAIRNYNINDDNNANVSIDNFIITKKYGRTEYTNLQPHAELVKRLMKENRNEFGLGDRVGYIIRCGNSKELLHQKSVLPEDILNGRYKLDSDYYINRQMFPPLERIFDVFNMSPLLLNKGQTTFDSFT